MDELTQAIADLRKVVVDDNPNRDRFPLGTVIRWIASERYTYAAIKTNVGWFTTARQSNPFVKPLMEYEALQKVLARPEATDIAVAGAWTGLDGSAAGTPVAVGGTLFREGGYTTRSGIDRYEDDYPGLAGESV